MLKTEVEIENDFKEYISNSELGKAINGKIYLCDERPTNARTEDIVISFLTGINSQLQTGVVVVNIYVPNKTNKAGDRVRDKKRIDKFQELINSYIFNDSSDYSIISVSTPNTNRFDDLDSHCVSFTIEFSRYAS